MGASANITLRSGLGRPLTINEVDANFSSIQTVLSGKVDESTYTASDILTKLKTVDGTGSGLDADALNGYPTASANLANTIPVRNDFGDFAANVITASLVGNVTGNVTGNLTGNVTGNVSGNAGTVNNGVYLLGDQTIAGTKTFSSTIVGSITGNAGTVTNGVYTSGDQTIGGNKTFSNTITGSITGNAGTVTNGVYLTGNQTIGGTKTFSSTIVGSINGNAATVTNGIYSTDVGTVTNTMLAGSIANNKLANSSITINGNAVSLGGSYNVPSSSTTTAGLTRLATSAEAVALADASAAITPSTLALAFKSTNQSLAVSGYQKMPGGLIMQWGNITLAANTAGTVNFPLVFPTAVFHVLVTNVMNVNDGAAEVAYVKTKASSNFTLYNPANYTSEIQYLAIGY